MIYHTAIPAEVVTTLFRTTNHLANTFDVAHNDILLRKSVYDAGIVYMPEQKFFVVSLTYAQVSSIPIDYDHNFMVGVADEGIVPVGYPQKYWYYAGCLGGSYHAFCGGPYILFADFASAKVSAVDLVLELPVSTNFVLLEGTDAGDLLYTADMHRSITIVKTYSFNDIISKGKLSLLQESVANYTAGAIKTSRSSGYLITSKEPIVYMLPERRHVRLLTPYHEYPAINKLVCILESADWIIAGSTYVNEVGPELYKVRIYLTMGPHPIRTSENTRHAIRVLAIDTISDNVYIGDSRPKKFRKSAFSAYKNPDGGCTFALFLCDKHAMHIYATNDLLEMLNFLKNHPDTTFPMSETVICEPIGSSSMASESMSWMEAIDQKPYAIKDLECQVLSFDALISPKKSIIINDDGVSVIK